MAAAAGGGLTEWAERSASRRADRLTAGGLERGRLRFAFYGRVSTEDWQDPVTSRARQLQQALMLAAGAGVITAEFFDTGGPASCRGPGARRPLLWLLSSRIRSGAGMRS